MKCFQIPNKNIDSLIIAENETEALQFLLDKLRLMNQSEMIGEEIKEKKIVELRIIL